MTVAIDELVHLHAHSEYSILDGLGSISRQMAIAKSKGFDSIALTDHGTLAGAVSFTIEAKRNGIKPILGVEGYIELDGQIGHITLLADGHLGFSNLVKLVNLGHSSDFRQPAFTVPQLMAHSDGVLCLTGCPASPFNSMTFGDALNLGAKLKSVFGPRLFAEVMFVADTDTWTRPLGLASQLKLKTVVTNDVHFGLREDAEVHPILTNMKGGFEYNSKQLWLKNSWDITTRALSFGVSKTILDEAISNTRKIADKIRSVKLERIPELPHIDHPKEIVVGKVKREIAIRDMGKEYIERAKYELGVIDNMGYMSYFVILMDIIREAERLGVRIGPGRGSGAGSLVLYLLGITDIDPLKYGLSFERFLNPERKGMPDVDVDFDSEGRDKILEYASEKWGGIPIATYSRYTHKVLTHDLSRQLRVPKELDIAAADGGETSRPFKKICSEIPHFNLSYKAMQNQIRHKGKHAGGVIITDAEVPIERIAKGTLAAAWSEGSRNELSYAGIVKFDLLGITVLSALRRLEKKHEFSAGIPVDGSPVFEIFRSGDLDGIFQFSGSPGIRDITVKLRPNTFNDLVAINALYRPGALDAGAVDMFPEWKMAPRKMPAYISDILDETYGAIVYQEQVMSIFQRTVGGTYGQADLARRLIVKSKPDDPSWVEKFDKLHQDFIDGAKRHGLSEGDSENLWEELATHSRYSFNKSHSVAYSRIAWETAWWKYYYPADFFTAMLNVDPKESQAYIMSATKHGIQIVPPNVNTSSFEYETDGKRIFLPLTAIKFFGENGVKSLIKIREEAGGSFKSLEQFMELVPKKDVRARAREGMFYLGSFDGLEGIEWDKIGTKKPLEKLSAYDAQVRHLGFVIPTKRLLETIQKYNEEGLTCGIIESIKKKKSSYGAYNVYYLSPSGVFWSRSHDGLKEGDIVVAKVSTKNGKAIKLEIIREAK